MCTDQSRLREIAAGLSSISKAAESQSKPSLFRRLPDGLHRHAHTPVPRTFPESGNLG